MKRGPIIHGVLLVAALIFAYQTWTREQPEERKTGDVKVWSTPVNQVSAVVYDTKDRTVRLERRQEGGDSYLWGSESRTKIKPKPPAQPGQEPGSEDMSEPAEPAEIDTREFAVGETGTAAIDNLAALHALRDLGQPSDADLKEYGLDESQDNITLSFQGGSRSLVVGGKVFASSDRYVRDPDSGKAYVLSGDVLKDLLAGEPGLRLRKVHDFTDDELARAVVSAGDKTRNLVRITVEEQSKKSKNWADAKAADKPDQTMSNFVQNMDKLLPSSYVPTVDPKTLTLKVKVDYQDASGKSLGWIELYEQAPEPATGATPAGNAPESPAAPDAGKPAAKPAAADAAKPAVADAAKPAAADAAKPESKPSYYIRTELTRTYASIAANAATRITDDIDQVFAQ